MSEHESKGSADSALTEQVDAMMLAARALMGIAAFSVAEVEDQVTLPQLRVLVLIETRGPVNLNTLAGEMGVHPSNATRACDRLVAAGYLRRRESDTDRRNLVLELTDNGQVLVESVTSNRRAAIATALAQIPDSRRRGLAKAMLAFAAAVDEPAESTWQVGWPGP